MLDAVAKDDWRWFCRIHRPLTFDVTSYNSLFNEHLAQCPCTTCDKADMHSISYLWELLATVSQSLHYIIGNTTGSLVGNQLTKLIMMSTRHIFSDLIPVSDVEWMCSLVTSWYVSSCENLAKPLLLVAMQEIHRQFLFSSNLVARRAREISCSHQFLFLQ